MSILNKINDVNIKFTKSEKQLIQYIKDNIQEFSYKSISEISKGSKIGESTITRFSKKIGFDGFPEFKVALAKEVTSMQSTNIIDINIVNSEHASDSANKILYNNIYVLENTSKIIDYDNVHKCSQIIKNARKVLFIGVGYSGVIAQDINYKFTRIGLNTSFANDSHTIWMMCSLLKKEDVLVCISHSGETEEIIKAINIAKENKATTISITRDSDSEIRSKSDLAFTYISNESVFETGSMHSKMAQMFLLDIIYTQVVKDIGSIAADNKLKTTKSIKN